LRNDLPQLFNCQELDILGFDVFLDFVHRPAFKKTREHSIPRTLSVLSSGEGGGVGDIYLSDLLERADLSQEFKYLIKSKIFIRVSVSIVNLC
jgi:L-amino acid N-acyltransferase YncA